MRIISSHWIKSSWALYHALPSQGHFYAYCPSSKETLATLIQMRWDFAKPFLYAIGTYLQNISSRQSEQMPLATSCHLVHQRHQSWKSTFLLSKWNHTPQIIYIIQLNHSGNFWEFSEMNLTLAFCRTPEIFQKVTLSSFEFLNDSCLVG